MKKKHGMTNMPTCEWVVTKPHHKFCGHWPAKKYGENYLCCVHTPHNLKALDELSKRFKKD